MMKVLERALLRVAPRICASFVARVAALERDSAPPVEKLVLAKHARLISHRIWEARLSRLP